MIVISFLCSLIDIIDDIMLAKSLHSCLCPRKDHHT